MSWQDTPCQPYDGLIVSSGYGQQPNGKNAHRESYKRTIGAIPDGLELDHLCRNRACINPKHLEPVTHKENTRRGMSPSGLNSRKTHCSKGHPFDGENLAVNYRGWRYCLTCTPKIRQSSTFVVPEVTSL
jgi:hypothetical protein